MHWSGKVFAWLLIPLILLAMVFTAKLVTVRNNWTAKLEKSKLKYADLAPKEVEAEAAWYKAQAEWHRATEFWGSYLGPLPTNVNPATGALAAKMGAPGIQQGQWMYGFEVQPDGTSIYRGDFVAGTVREGESLMQPNWRVREGDMDGWQAGNWRWRFKLPPAYPNFFDEFQQTLLRQDELLADRQQSLLVQQDLIRSATAQLKLREAELVGGPELPQDAALDLEYRQGLVAAIEELEEVRNAELISGDRLRRSVRDLNQRIEATQAKNRELVRTLPQPATEVSQQP